eukprot:2694454-Amphidinium_carterae.1
MMATTLASGHVECAFQTLHVPVAAYICRCRAALAHYSDAIQGANTTPLELTDPLTTEWLRLKQTLGMTMPEDLLLINQPHLAMGKGLAEQRRLSTQRAARARAACEARSQRALALGESAAEAARQAEVAAEEPTIDDLSEEDKATWAAITPLRTWQKINKGYSF